MSKASDLFVLFGSASRLADALGVNKSVVVRWDYPPEKRGSAGAVPTHYNHRILEAATLAGIDRAAVAACLDEHSCPCCGAALEPGRHLNWRHLRAMGAEG